MPDLIRLVASAFTGRSLKRDLFSLAAALALTTLALGIALGAKAFGCRSDELGADHVTFAAFECAQVGAELQCLRTVAPR